MSNEVKIFYTATVLTGAALAMVFPPHGWLWPLVDGLLK